MHGQRNMKLCLLAPSCLPVLLQCNRSRIVNSFFAKLEINIPTKICEHIPYLLQIAETTDPRCVCVSLRLSLANVKDHTIADGNRDGRVHNSHL
jgi:hypothetical protein